MTGRTMRAFSRAFCNALATCEATKVADFLDDDVECSLFGPIDLFPFFGQRRGKPAMLAMCAEIAANLTLRGCDEETASISDNRYAALLRLTAMHPPTGRTLSFRLAYFAGFRDGKLIDLKVLLDSFDAAEQVLGREIDLSTAA
ncbi:MAG: nuclear transport factor 2 family protein [Rhizobiales bacterium]|nr:nuclear transport factor 2 family protein [Hyphomicrobiales bacterium]